MEISARFASAISLARPRGVRVKESFSPKLGRRLQCFGEDAFRQWIRLEAEPSVETFCERPTYRIPAMNNGWRTLDLLPAR